MSQFLKRLPSPLVLIIPTALLIGVYLVVVNNSSISNIELAGKKIQLEKLQAQVKELDIQARELQSISRVQELSGQLGLDKTGSFEYLKPSGLVAVKQ